MKKTLELKREDFVFSIHVLQTQESMTNYIITCVQYKVALITYKLAIYIHQDIERPVKMQEIEPVSVTVN